MSEMTCREAFGVLQRHAQTLRTQTEPDIDNLIPLVTESVAACKGCQERIDAVERALAETLASAEGGESGAAGTDGSLNCTVWRSATACAGKGSIARRCRRMHSAPFRESPTALSRDSDPPALPPLPLQSPPRDHLQQEAKQPKAAVLKRIHRMTQRRPRSSWNGKNVGPDSKADRPIAEGSRCAAR